MTRSLTDQGPRYTGGPPIDEAAAHRRWREVVGLCLLKNFASHEH
jgi:hypothetical protein